MSGWDDLEDIANDDDQTLAALTPLTAGQLKSFSPDEKKEMADLVSKVKAAGDDNAQKAHLIKEAPGAALNLLTKLGVGL